MSFPKIFAALSLLLFAGIFIASLFKGDKGPELEVLEKFAVGSSVEVSVFDESFDVSKQVSQEENYPRLTKVKDDVVVPEVDRINELFNTGLPKLPIVETITYTSRVPWVKGRPAWIADYAKHFKTSRFFISRSLTGRPDYFAHSVANRDRFNVFSLDREVNFHLVIDVTRLKMLLYVYDGSENERVLLKTYDVGLGRRDSSHASGLLTPLGTYSLGDRIAVYKPGVMGYFNHEKTEMIRIFGTRWIPFDQEIKNCTAPAKGFGLHGAPWDESSTGEFREVRDSIGKYESDGCIRFALEDIEELYAVVTTKPTFVHLVTDFRDAELPGKKVPEQARAIR